MTCFSEGVVRTDGAVWAATGDWSGTLMSPGTPLDGTLFRLGLAVGPVVISCRDARRSLLLGKHSICELEDYVKSAGMSKRCSPGFETCPANIAAYAGVAQTLVSHPPVSLPVPHYCFTPLCDPAQTAASHRAVASKSCASVFCYPRDQLLPVA